MTNYICECDECNGQAQYDAQFDPGPAVVDEIAAMIEDAKRNGASPQPVTLTFHPERK